MTGKHERCADKDSKIGCYDVLEVSDSWIDMQKHKIIKVAGSLAKIQTGNHQNTSLEHYGYEKCEAKNNQILKGSDDGA
jgi:hypothetical protein